MFVQTQVAGRDAAASEAPAANQTAAALSQKIVAEMAFAAKSRKDLATSQHLAMNVEEIRSAKEQLEGMQRRAETAAEQQAALAREALRCARQAHGKKQQVAEPEVTAAAVPEQQSPAQKWRAANAAKRAAAAGAPTLTTPGPIARLKARRTAKE